MKKILFAISSILLISLHLVAQDTISNFYIEQGKVTWKKKFVTENAVVKTFNMMKLSGQFTTIDSVDGKIIGTIKPVVADYRGAGYKLSTTSILLGRSDVTGFINVSFDVDGMITVKINQVTFISRESNALMKIGEKTDLEDTVLNNKGQFKTGKLWATSQTLEILDYTFSLLLK